MLCLEADLIWNDPSDPQGKGYNALPSSLRSVNPLMGELLVIGIPARQSIRISSDLEAYRKQRKGEKKRRWTSTDLNGLAFVE